MSVLGDGSRWWIGSENRDCGIFDGDVCAAKASGCHAMGEQCPEYVVVIADGSLFHLEWYGFYPHNVHRGIGCECKEALYKLHSERNCL